MKGKRQRQYRVPPEQYFKLVGVKVLPETRKNLEAIAAQEEKSLSALCREILDQYVTENTTRYALPVYQNSPAA